MSERQEFLQDVLYPVCLVRAKSAGGSGTVVWSGVGDKGKIETYVLTNYHVISGLIKVEKKFDEFLKREQMKETLATAEVSFYRYPGNSRCEGKLEIQADIVAYSQDLDLGLLKLRSGLEADFVAKMAEPDREEDIFLGEPVCAVGAALGHPPIMTNGHINYMDDEIDNSNYWLTSANIIFGNSGGAVFLHSTHEFIGIPSRVAVAQIGWSASAITHMGFFIPFPVIYEWLRSQYYHFIIGEETYEKCKEDRERAKDEMGRMADLNQAQLIEPKKDDDFMKKYYYKR